MTPNDRAWTAWMRSNARRVCAAHGTVSAVELREIAEGADWEPDYRNAYSWVFKEPGWEKAGRRRCLRPESHRRCVTAWRWWPEGVG